MLRRTRHQRCTPHSIALVEQLAFFWVGRLQNFTLRASWLTKHATPLGKSCMEIAETLPRTTPGTSRNTFVRFASLTTPVLWLRLKSVERNVGNWRFSRCQRHRERCS